MVKFIKVAAICLAVVMFATFFAGCKAAPTNTAGNKTDVVSIKSADDLAGKKIGVQEGTTGDLYVSDTANVAGAQVSRFKKGIDAAQDLKNGKLDAVVIDSEPAKKIVEQMSGLVILEKPLTVEEYAIAVAKGNTELLNLIDSTLDELTANGRIAAIKNAFVPAEGEKVALTPSAYAKKDGLANLVMGTNAEFEPFEYKQGEEIVGYDVEIAKEIALKAGKNLKIEDMAFDSLIAALKSGKVDMVVAGMSVTDERKVEVDFSKPYFSASQVIIVRAESAK